MTEPKATKLTRILHTRVTGAEHAALTKLARRSRMTTSAYIRARLFNGAP